PISLGQLRAASRGRATEHLYQVSWTTIPTPPAPSDVDLVAVGSGTVPDGPARERFADLAALSAAVDEGRPVPAAVLLAVPRYADAAGDPVPAAAHAAVHAVRSQLLAWLADERFEASRLIVATRNAVAATPEDGVAGMTQSPVWGLVRAAQAEHPGRI